MNISLFHAMSDIDYVLAIQKKKNSREAGLLFDHCYDYFIKTMLKKDDIDIDKVQDLFQDSIILLLEQIANFNIQAIEGKLYRWKLDRKAKQMVQEPMTCNLRTYIVSIGELKWKNETRKKDRNNVSMDKVPLYITPRSNPEEEALITYKHIVLTDSINKLSTGCQQLLRLSIYEQLSNEEILKKLAPRYSNDESLKSGKNKCVKKLKEIAKQNFENPFY